MNAEERAREMLWRRLSLRIGEEQCQAIADQIRQAEQAAREKALEEAAQIADKHQGAAAKLRRDKGMKLGDIQDDGIVVEIQCEERGEDIASEIIANSIRALKEKQ